VGAPPFQGKFNGGAKHFFFRGTGAGFVAPQTPPEWGYVAPVSNSTKTRWSRIFFVPTRVLGPHVFFCCVLDPLFFFFTPFPHFTVWVFMLRRFFIPKKPLKKKPGFWFSQGGNKNRGVFLTPLVGLDHPNHPNTPKHQPGAVAPKLLVV